MRYLSKITISGRPAHRPPNTSGTSWLATMAAASKQAQTIATKAEQAAPLGCRLKKWRSPCAAETRPQPTEDARLRFMVALPFVLA